MRIDALVVCVGYDDFLSVTLPLNKSLFDRLLVVTTPSDLATKAICDYYYVECLQTEAFSYKGKFNKGNAIEEALGYLNAPEWILHLDADIVLPPKAGSILHNLNLNEQFIYGCDRMNCPSPESWRDYTKAMLPQHELAYVHPGPYPLSTRICKMDQGGYIPIGFFQMFHRAANVLQSRPWYPTEYGSAATSDELFALKWARSHRHMLPEIIAIHLDTPPEDGKFKQMGANWDGRKTPRFELKEKGSPFGEYTRIPPRIL